MESRFLKDSTEQERFDGRTRNSVSLFSHNSALLQVAIKSTTYRIELEFLSTKVDGASIFIHDSIDRGGASSGLRAGEGASASGKGDEGSGGLHGSVRLDAWKW